MRHVRSTGTRHPRANMTGSGGSCLGTLSGPDRWYNTHPRLPGSTTTHAHHLDQATVGATVPYQTLCWCVPLSAYQRNASDRPAVAQGAPDMEAQTERVATQPVEGQVLTPDWVKEAVFYHIFPDRFASSSRVVKPPNLEPWEVPPTTHG